MISSSFRPPAACVCLLLLFLTAAFAGSTVDPVILRLDLRSMGATGLQVPSEERDRPVYNARISFIDNSTLAVSFPVFNPVLKLSTREHPTGGSILLHTVVLDISSGHIDAERSWGNAGKTEIIPAGPRFVIISGRLVQIVSRDLKPEREYRYSLNVPFRLRTSETGKTLFLLAQAAENEEVVQVLDPAGQRSPYTFRVPSEGDDAFSDVNFAFTRQVEKKSEIIRAPLEQLRRGASDLHALSLQAEGRCREPFFITDDLLILGGVCDQLTVLGADGSIKAKHQIPAVRFYGPAGSLEISELNFLSGFVVSRDKKRFAVVLRDAQVQHRKGELPSPVYHPRTLAVYDTSLAPLFRTPVPQSLGTFAVDQAISPDGSLVALLAGWDVYVYRVPDSAEQ